MNSIFGNFVGGRIAVALLIVRVVFGLGIFLHGVQKLGMAGAPFGWMGPQSPMPGVLQGLALLSEVGGGLALIFGLLTPLAALGLAATMLVAATTVHIASGHPFVSGGGKPSFELAALYLAVALGILAAGPGAFSIDALLFGRKRKEQ